MDEERFEKIEQIIGYKFSNRELLAKAFTHSSVTENRLESNERMEFLGDSILAMVTCQTLFDRFPNYLEGDLTKVKSMLVSRRTCAKVTKQLSLQKLLKVGKGVIFSGAITGSLAAGLLEAIIAAIYIDGGLEPAREFIIRTFTELLDTADAKHPHGNFKSLLQQYAQKSAGNTPAYLLLDEKGPDHDKCFESQAVINGRHFKSAWGTNKKDAEQKAAFNALVELGVLKDSPPESPE